MASDESIKRQVNELLNEVKATRFFGAWFFVCLIRVLDKLAVVAYAPGVHRV